MAAPMPESPTSATRIFILVPCGGNGSRAGAGGPKQYRSIAGKALVSHTLDALVQVPGLAGVLVVVSPDDVFFPVQSNTTVSVSRNAGPTRRDTVFNGIKVLLDCGATPQDWVLVHDAARCLVTTDMVGRLIDACKTDSVGGLLALKLPDTLKAEVDGRVQATLDRSDKWLAQTPQMFHIGMLLDALLQAEASGVNVTDEASAIEAAGFAPLLVTGSAQNFKVTYPEDFALAEAVLLARQPKETP
ncbi:MAG: 2-C-methyl-D-erythritol 4-phosphate cytidylyltransferase [Burkholderiaceae bacterium]|nr:2-C-methyl-D-erythritol 4-phosphate cytidylyltransferase [Burkholderiaceae bacterium]